MATRVVERECFKREGLCCLSRYLTARLSRTIATRGGGSLGLGGPLRRLKASPESETPPAGVMPTEGVEWWREKGQKGRSRCSFRRLSASARL